MGFWIVSTLETSFCLQKFETNLLFCGRRVLTKIRYILFPLASNVHEIQKMNLLPASWLLTVLQNHYYSVGSSFIFTCRSFFEKIALKLHVKDQGSPISPPINPLSRMDFESFMPPFEWLIKWLLLFEIISFLSLFSCKVEVI